MRVLQGIFVSTSISLIAQSSPFDIECSRLTDLKDWEALRKFTSEEISRNPKSVSAWFALGVADAGLKDGTDLIKVLKGLAGLDLSMRVKLLDNSLVDSFLFKNAPPRIRTSQIQLKLQPSAPPYPLVAKDRGIQGDVLVEVWVDAEGKPEKVFPLWGPLELQQSAVEYMYQWRFNPCLIEGKPSPARFRNIMDFKLRRGGLYQRLPNDLRPL